MSGKILSYLSVVLCILAFLTFVAIALHAFLTNGLSDIILVNKKYNDSSQDVRNYVRAVEHIPNWSRNGLFTAIYALVLCVFVFALLSLTALPILSTVVISSIVLVIGYVLMLMAVQCNQSYFSFHVLQDGGTHFR